MLRLLIIEDDTDLRQALGGLLEASGYEVVACARGVPGFEALLTARFDLAIIDLMLPDKSGLEIVREVRQRSSKPPILILTARNSVADRVTGLDAGADDYLVKPFKMPELEARVRALLRPSVAGTATPVRVGRLTLLPGDPRVLFDGTPVLLPPGEFAMLELLATRGSGAVSKASIAARLARGGESLTGTAIEVCIHRLRRRLAPFGLKIRALRGFGYVLEYPK